MWFIVLDLGSPPVLCMHCVVFGASNIRDIQNACNWLMPITHQKVSFDFLSLFWSNTLRQSDKMVTFLVGILYCFCYAMNNSVSEHEICRKYIWGICDKHPTQCRFKHIRNIELMQKFIKFCYGFQNRGCFRPNCSYLHASREDVRRFKYSRQIPQVLMDRYNAMDARLLNNSNGISSVNGAMFVPSPPAVGEAFQMLSHPPPSITLSQNNVNFAQLPVRQQAMAPLNPTPPVTNNYHYLSGTSQNSYGLQRFPLNSVQSTLPPMFDPTRPPPGPSVHREPVMTVKRQRLSNDCVTSPMSYGHQRFPLNSVQSTSPPMFDPSIPPPGPSVSRATTSRVQEANAQCIETQSHESFNEQPVMTPKKPRLSNDSLPSCSSSEAASRCDDEPCAECVQRMKRLEEYEVHARNLYHSPDDLPEDWKRELQTRKLQMIVEVMEMERRRLFDITIPIDVSDEAHEQRILGQMIRILIRNSESSLGMPGPSRVLAQTRSSNQMQTNSTRSEEIGYPNYHPRVPPPNMTNFGP